MRWGIISTGSVANAFADALVDVPGHELAAVASRAIESASRFAHERGARNAYNSVELMCADDDLDAVYVASPASHHYRHTMTAVQAGRPVLCEKPFMVNAAQAIRVQNEAVSRNLLVMEAMWTRFLPSYQKIRELVGDGAIGELLAIHATFGGRASYVPHSRPFRLDLAGGALMDAAVYPISLAQMLCPGPAVCTRAVATRGLSGVDGQVALTIQWQHGVLMTAMAGITTTFESTAMIYGSKGMLVIPAFINPTWIRLDRPGQEPVTYDVGSGGHRFAWEIEAFGRLLAHGRHASTLMPLDDSVQIMGVLNAAKDEIGLRFPDDVEAT